MIRVANVPVTTVARSIVDVARERGHDVALVAADAAVRTELVTARELDDAFSRQRGWPGRSAAAQALALVDPDAESPLETLSRLRMGECALPKPTLQQEIGDEYGSPLGRVDFYWDEFGVVGEADGEMKYDSLAAVTAEKRRQSRLLETGLIVVRWQWQDLRHFDAVGQRLRSAFRRGRRRGDGRAWSLLEPRSSVPEMWAI